MTSQERRILVVTSSAHFLCHYNVMVFPAVVIPLSKMLNLSIPEVLGLSFWMYLLFGLTALPWGLASDRFGARPMLLFFFLGSCVSAFLAAWFIDRSPLFSLALAGVGLFAGSYHPAGLGLISRGIEKISLALGVNGITGNLGLTLAPLMSGFLTWVSGPRAAFVFLGFLNLAGLLAMLFLSLDEPEAQVKPAAQAGNGTLKYFVGFLGITCLTGLTFTGATVILPTYFELKMPDLLTRLAAFWPGQPSHNMMATALMSLAYVVGCLGQYLCGHLADRHDPRYVYGVFHALTLPAAVVMGLSTDWPLFWASMIYLFFLLGMQPSENTLVARFSPGHLRHSAYGIKFTLTFGVGSLAVKFMAAIERAWGLDQVLPALAGVTLVIVLAIGVFVLWTSRRPWAAVEAPSR